MYGVIQRLQKSLHQIVEKFLCLAASSLYEAGYLFLPILTVSVFKYHNLCEERDLR